MPADGTQAAPSKIHLDGVCAAGNAARRTAAATLALTSFWSDIDGDGRVHGGLGLVVHGVRTWPFTGSALSPTTTTDPASAPPASMNRARMIETRPTWRVRGS